MGGDSATNDREPKEIARSKWDDNLLAKGTETLRAICPLLSSANWAEQRLAIVIPRGHDISFVTFSGRQFTTTIHQAKNSKVPSHLIMKSKFPFQYFPQAVQFWFLIPDCWPKIRFRVCHFASSVAYPVIFSTEGQELERLADEANVGAVALAKHRVNRSDYERVWELLPAERRHHFHGRCAAAASCTKDHLHAQTGRK